jgi:FixJ family two-component response regulator
VRPSLLIGIVDDDPDVRRSLDSLMRSAGMKARCFASAEELLMSDTRCDDLACIVTDLHMPGMTGLELQAEIGRRGWQVPVILMTAYPTDATRHQAMEAGAAAFLTKPVDPDALLEAIDQAAA